MSRKKHWIIPLCILLLVLVFVSGIILGTQIGKFTNVEPYTEVVLSDDSTNDNDDKDSEDDKNNTDDKKQTEYIPEPGMTMNGQTVDGTVVTDLSIFCATYANGSDDITVRSLGDDKVVAPGTSNTHVVRVTNTGNCALDYELNVKDLFPDVAEDRVVPIEIRLADYQGNYVIGDKDSWVSLEDLNVTCHTGTVGKNSYVYYTLEWQWPFEAESEVDVYDTLLGTLSNTEKIECGIKITTMAEPNPDPNAEGGFWAPQTGDNNNMTLWLSVAGISLLVLVIFLFVRSRKDNEEE